MESESKAIAYRRSPWVRALLIFASRWRAPHKFRRRIFSPAQTFTIRAMDELQQMVAPIALYPDALLAQVLTASTYPDDVIAAARWEDAGNDPQAADSQPWDSSVKGVAQ